MKNVSVRAIPNLEPGAEVPLSELNKLRFDEGEFLLTTMEQILPCGTHAGRFYVAIGKLTQRHCVTLPAEIRRLTGLNSTDHYVVPDDDFTETVTYVRVDVSELPENEKIPIIT